MCCGRDVGLGKAQYSVDNVVLSKQRALLGDTLTATCDIHNGPKTRVLVYWVRRTPKQRPVEISVNRGLNNEFRQTGRYSLSYVAVNDDLRHMQFKLNITGKILIIGL